MAGILGIYGMIVAVIIAQKSTSFWLSYGPIPTEKRICSPCFRVMLWIQLTCSWFGNWNRGRRGCESECATGQNFCGNDSDFDFWRSFGIVRPHRLTDLNVTMIDNLNVNLIIIRSAEYWIWKRLFDQIIETIFWKFH
jgi:hypothetical protein